jgi:glycine/serine hydroxymethyltransferase
MSNTEAFFTQTLAQHDSAVRGSMLKELERQQSQVEMIASENIVSRAVLEALAIDRLKKRFSAEFANVQPHSGAQANGAVKLALERTGITCNKNGIPFDTEKPTVTSGMRLGTPTGIFALCERFPIYTHA